VARWGRSADLAHRLSVRTCLGEGFAWSLPSDQASLFPVPLLLARVLLHRPGNRPAPLPLFFSGLSAQPVSGPYPIEVRHAQTHTEVLSHLFFDLTTAYLWVLLTAGLKPFHDRFMHFGDMSMPAITESFFSQLSILLQPVIGAGSLGCDSYLLSCFLPTNACLHHFHQRQFSLLLLLFVHRVPPALFGLVSFSQRAPSGA
jgi:hypothetical protein